MIGKWSKAVLAAALMVVAMGPGWARADVIGYASAVGGGIYSVDLTTATATLIGNSGINLMEGLAISPTGVLYGGDDQGNLYTLSTTTGAITKTIGSTGFGNLGAMSFRGNTLLGMDFTNTASSLYSISTTTGAATLIAPTNPGVPLAQALTFAGTATTGYFVSNETNQQSIYSITSTGVTTYLGAAKTYSGFSVALGSDSTGALYALDSLGFAYSVSQTGTYTQIGSTGNHFFLDLTIPNATTNAVPEPSSMILCGIAGIIGAACTRARRRRAIA